MQCGKTARLWIIHSVLSSHLSRWVPSARDKPNSNAALGRKGNHQLPKLGDLQGCGQLGEPLVQQVGEARAVLEDLTFSAVATASSKPSCSQAKPCHPQATLPTVLHQAVPFLPSSTMPWGKERS